MPAVLNTFADHVIAVRPNAQLGIVEEVAGQMKTVPIPRAGCVARLGNGDALVLRNSWRHLEWRTD